jgi:hypothetical protein
MRRRELTHPTSRRRATRLIIYFDTSALVKRVIAEEGSELASELWAAPQFEDLRQQAPRPPGIEWRAARTGLL